MISRNSKDNKLRKNYSLNEIKRKVYKALFIKENFSIDSSSKCFLPRDIIYMHHINTIFKFKLDSLVAKGSLTRVHNNCIYTGRRFGITKKLNMSRLTIKYLLVRKELSGYYRENR